VDNTNITTQGYLLADIGQSKVRATTESIGRLDSTIRIEVVDDRYRPKLDVGKALFCCVDSIEAAVRSGDRPDTAPRSGRMAGCWVRRSAF